MPVHSKHRVAIVLRIRIAYGWKRRQCLQSAPRNIDPLPRGLNLRAKPCVISWSKAADPEQAPVLPPESETVNSPLGRHYLSEHQTAPQHGWVPIEGQMEGILVALPFRSSQSQVVGVPFGPCEVIGIRAVVLINRIRAGRAGRAGGSTISSNLRIVGGPVDIRVVDIRVVDIWVVGRSYGSSRNGGAVGQRLCDDEVDLPHKVGVDEYLYGAAKTVGEVDLVVVGVALQLPLSKRGHVGLQRGPRRVDEVDHALQLPAHQIDGVETAIVGVYLADSQQQHYAQDHCFHYHQINMYWISHVINQQRQSESKPSPSSTSFQSFPKRNTAF